MLEKEGESGASVVVLTPGEASSDAKGGSGSDESKEGDYPFTLPSFLIRIEEDAFSGIGATSIYIGDRVEYIGSRAFAYCRNLRAIHIPASVAEIKPDAFNGCSNATLTIYGVRPSAAADFADTYGYKFVDLNASTSAPNPTDDPGEVPVPLATNTDPPVSLPFVPAH